MVRNLHDVKNRGQLSASHRNNQRRIWISRLQNSGEPTCQIKYWETKIMNSIGLEWLKHSETWKRLVHCHTDFQTCSKSIVEPAQTGSIRFATVAYSKNMMNTTDRYLFRIFNGVSVSRGRLYGDCVPLLFCSLWLLLDTPCTAGARRRWRCDIFENLKSEHFLEKSFF